MPLFPVSCSRVRAWSLFPAATIVSVAFLWILISGTPVAYAFTNLVFSDEFNGSSSNVDATKWSFDLGNSSTIAGGGWGNSEKETYTSRTNNAYVANGLLHIVTINDQGGSAPYSSARLQTLGKFSATYGRVEFRAKLPANGPYWWPALWMLATNYSGSANVTNQWPRCGEIDVMESKGSTPGDVLGTIHKDSSGNPGVDQPTGGQFNFPAGDGTTNFHTYVLSWSSNSITFSVDNNTPYETITSWSSSIGPFPTPFNHPFYIIMNLAVGGNFVGNPGTATINAASTFPQEMQIDYVRVYQDTPVQAPLLGVIAVSPTNGCLSGGTVVTITGTNFVAGASVKIGGTTASTTYVNTNTLTAVTPALPAGAKNVVVTNPDGMSSTLVNGFNYLSGPSSFAGLGSITAATHGATLTWSAASGVSPFTYNVYEATASGTESFGSPTLTTNALSVFVSSLNCSTTYYFVVRAVDSCGNGDNNSVERSVQPLAAPTVFSGLTNIIAATEGATLTWSAASGESPLTYNVYEATRSGTENFSSPILTTSSLSAFISPLSCSNTYYFVVRAVGGCGTGDSNLVERSVQTLPVPPVFSGLASVTAATEGATLTWSAASGGSPITYNVFEATTSGAENFGSPILTTNGLSTFIAPLYPGSNSPITYFFVVRAQGGCGSGESNTVERSIQPLLDPNKSQVGDGIPNGWKQQYGFNPFDPTVAAADPDGDGMSNLQEFLAGTDPTNSASYFHIISIAPQGNDVLITWTCGGGRTNVVQAATDLVSSTYSNVSDNIILPGTGDRVTNYLDAGAATNAPVLFYHIQLVP
jgi:beta-glucanase (GH16 family)